MARQTKKHAREVRRDRFRDGALKKVEAVGDRLEGRGPVILYALAGLALAGLLAFGYSYWSARKANEAQRAMGRALSMATAPVASASAPATDPASEFNFATERERAERAAEEFRRVAEKYGEPFRSQANYLRATHLLSVDRQQGVSQLESLARGGGEVAAWAKFALAQAREGDGNYDAAAALYRELASAPEPRPVPADTANLRLASVLEKQGKTAEAAEILFQIAKTSREAKDKDGKPVQPSAAARDAAEKLEKLDPARHAQLPPEPPPAAGALGG